VRRLQVAGLLAACELIWQAAGLRQEAGVQQQQHVTVCRTGVDQHITLRSTTIIIDGRLTLDSLCLTGPITHRDDVMTSWPRAHDNDDMTSRNHVMLQYRTSVPSRLLPACLPSFSTQWRQCYVKAEVLWLHTVVLNAFCETFSVVYGEGRDTQH